MTKTALNKAAVPALAKKILGEWSHVSRNLKGVKDLPKFRSMGMKGYLTLAELEAIGTEKSPRRKELLSENSNNVVVKVTREAFVAISERERMSLLCSLRGVGIPRASAILSWTFPEKWPVIDVRAWRTLEHHKVVSGRKQGTNLGFIQWEVYLSAVDELMHHLRKPELTPQKVDRILYQMDADKNGRKRKGTCRK
ncbi:hypothetical protein [Ruegeria sp. HKCCA6837]|uniref:hypothetical protein n=1 Tax=Ruegeria sp. HKCCA6837 TaxID=2682989 RepID=UPI0014878F5A|nr:hypothetical protein [Ruegeria sp. HKCCA6837]